MGKIIKNVTLTKPLNHIAFIMDGNGRWASSRGLPRHLGHKEACNRIIEVFNLCKAYNIKVMSFYAFSTENWKRKQEEVDFLMDLVAVTLTNELSEMHKENVQIRFIGDLTRLSEKLQKVLDNAVNTTKNNTGVILQIALNYGSRDEITNAVKQIVHNGIKEENITQNLISEYLYTKGVPDPDLLIRTGGEQRISNYLLWQIAYSEILITPKYWPDFDKKLLAECIEEFKLRQRRYGK